MAHFMKIIETLLSHIRDKNKIKNRNSLFHLVQCFKTNFYYNLFNVSTFKAIICFIWFNISRLFISLTHKTLCISIHPFHFCSFIYTCPHPFMSSHIKYTQTKNDVIYLQHFNNTYITPTLSYHLILTCRLSKLWPRKGACVFYSVTIAYSFDVEVERFGFYKGCDLLWVFGCLGFWFGKIINVFYFRTKEKEKETFYLIIYEISFFLFFILELIMCRFLCKFFYYYIVWYEP